MAQVKPSDSANTGIDATVDPSSPIPVRESQVENGVRFLLHPSVASSPLNERTAFLVKKGLSKEEIDMAVTRALELRVEHEEDTEGKTRESYSCDRARDKIRCGVMMYFSRR